MKAKYYWESEFAKSSIKNILVLVAAGHPFPAKKKTVLKGHHIEAKYGHPLWEVSGFRGPLIIFQDNGYLFWG